MNTSRKDQIRFSAYAWVTLAVNVLVILWGAYVRATGSGAGCGGHWPLCNGVVLPREPALDTIIEYTHRISSGLALVLVAGLLLFAWRVYPRGDRVRGAATASGILIILEALLGAGLVIFELVGGNTSLQRAFAGAAHLLNTFLLLAALSLTCSWSTWETAPLGERIGRKTPWLALSLLGVLLIGMTGAIAALGDTLFPAGSLAEGVRLDLDPGSHFLIRLRGLHPLIAIIVSFYVLGMIRVLEEGEPASTKIGRAVSGLVLIQVIAGAVNLLLLAPVWLQLVHLFLADSLWIGLVLFSDRALRKPA